VHTISATAFNSSDEKVGSASIAMIVKKLTIPLIGRSNRPNEDLEFDLHFFRKWLVRGGNGEPIVLPQRSGPQLSAPI
jgi:hypothetical protein